MRKNVYILIVFIIAMSSFLLLSNNFTTEEKIEKVLFAIYENNYEDFTEESFDKMANSLSRIDSKRRRGVKNFFTDDGYENITRRSLMTHLHSFISGYKCSSIIDKLDIDIRETSDPNAMVCYYDLTVRFEFENTEKSSMYTDFSGSISLYKEKSSWYIDTIIGSRLFNEQLRLQFDNHK